MGEELSNITFFISGPEGIVGTIGEIKDIENEDGDLPVRNIIRESLSFECSVKLDAINSQKLFSQLFSNNWLKLHGFSMRRRCKI